MQFWIISIFFSATFGLPTTNHAGQPKCEDIFSNNGLNFSTFHVGAARGLHSLSLEEIRHFFKEDASEENGIPAFNIRLQDYKVQIHDNTPLWGYEDRFDTWALKVMDWFMLNDKDSLYLAESNTLEKIIHRYHMHEIYQKAAVTYKDLVENPPKDGICPCATDIVKNGILADVYSIAGVMQEQFDQHEHGRVQAAMKNSRVRRQYNDGRPHISREEEICLLFPQSPSCRPPDYVELPNCPCYLCPWKCSGNPNKRSANENSRVRRQGYNSRPRIGGGYDSYDSRPASIGGYDSYDSRPSSIGGYDSYDSGPSSIGGYDSYSSRSSSIANGGGIYPPSDNCPCYLCPWKWNCRVPTPSPPKDRIIDVIGDGEVTIEEGNGKIIVSGNGKTIVNPDGTTTVICGGSRRGQYAADVRVNCIDKRSADEEVETVETLMDNYLTHSDKDTAKRIVTSSAAWTPGSLAGPELGKEKWVPLAAEMTYALPDDEGIRDFAYFMYCMLNREETPRPK